MISKNNSRISLGTIVRLWHDTRGHDYVVVGVSRRDKKIALIKHNCINRDGSIHASTANYYLAHKTLNYSSSLSLTIDTVLPFIKLFSFSGVFKILICSKICCISL